MIGMFPKRLKQLRKNKKLTQQDLADYLGISRQGYAKYENGHSEADYNTLQKLSDFYSVTIDYLLGHSNKPNQTEEEEFQAFINDPELERWYRELPKSEEEDLRRLRQIWQIIKEKENKED